ncbi:hypothetical protein LguiB_032389 [Lonicera macranthoides]
MRMMSMDMDWDWARLPLNILDQILDRLVDLSDYVQFASVCHSWRSAALDDRNHRGKNNQDRQLPMLMLPHSTHDDRAQFYSVTQEKILKFQLKVPYYTKRFIGSSFGWLISVDTDFAVTLFNPFSASTIRLPPVITSDVRSLDEGYYDIHYFNHEYYFVKAILSADPASHPDECVLILIYGDMKRLAFIRPGAGAGPGPGPAAPCCWRYLELPMHGFCDVIYSKSSRLFYALRETGEVCSIDIEKEKADCFTPALEIGGPCDLRYIVETRNGDLLQVYRFLRDSFNGTTLHTGKIKVFKLGKTTTTTTTTPVCYWAELKSLGDNALFVGDCTSMCFAASDFPGCRPGSIYFSLPLLPYLLITPKPIRDCTRNEMGVLKIQGKWKRVEPFHINYRRYDVSNAIANRPPIWVVPTFQERGRRHRFCLAGSVALIIKKSMSSDIPSSRSAGKILQNARVVQLPGHNVYADLSLSQCSSFTNFPCLRELNAEKNGEEMFDLLLSVTVDALYEKYFQGNQDWMVELDSSTKDMHVSSIDVSTIVVRWSYVGLFGLMIDLILGHGSCVGGRLDHFCTQPGVADLLPMPLCTGLYSSIVEYELAALCGDIGVTTRMFQELVEYIVGMKLSNTTAEIDEIYNGSSSLGEAKEVVYRVVSSGTFEKVRGAAQVDEGGFDLQQLDVPYFYFQRVSHISDLY